MATAVEVNGRLQVIGAQICGDTGAPVQLRGMSSHGITWDEGRYMTPHNVGVLANEWGASVVRAARYVLDYDDKTFISNEKALERIFPVVEAAIQHGTYMIVDWHVLKDHDPNRHKEEAIQFFREIHSRFGNHPALIYEIANEPNSQDGRPVTWDSHIRPYALDVATTIRGWGSQALILVGTPEYCQHPEVAVENPLPAYIRDVLYTVHFYAGSPDHMRDILPRMEDAIGAKLPLFVSEWGTCHHSGNKEFSEELSRKWIEYLNKNLISWVNWSLCAKNETSAALLPGAPREGPWGDECLTLSGKLVKELIARK